MIRSIIRHRTWLRTGATIATATLLLGPLTACSEDEPNTATSPIAEPSEPESSETHDGPVAPEPPASIDKANAAGARAFVKYYFDLLNYTQSTGNSRRAARAGMPGCESCSAATSAIEAVYANGGSVDGGRLTTHSVYVTLGERSSAVLPADAMVRASTERQVISRKNGKTKTYPSDQLSIDMSLTFDNSGWRVAEWSVR